MTDRPEGTPEETPDESELPEAEPVVEPEPAAEADAAPEPEPTGEEAEPEPAVEPEAADEVDTTDDAVEDGGPETDDTEPFASDAEADVSGEPLADDPAAASETIAVPAGTGRRRGAPPPARAPTVSEVAVHVSEPWSKVFVVATVVVFVAILLNGILLGTGGIITGTPTPRPTAVPTASPSPAPSASPSEAPSSSAAPSASPAS